MILALETSCDDTCAAVMDHDATLLSSIVGSQSVHDLYGGVVPELAARHHLEMIGPVVSLALERAGVGLDSIRAVAVTQGPGLTGALLVGISTAKGIALSRRLPLIAVDHLHGHVAASWLADPDIEPPFLCLIASGGHTLLVEVLDHQGGWRVLGSTLDDAAGEAFDKGARLLGLGYPGGPEIERTAASGDPTAFAFPVARGVAGLDFSFSGLKTSLLHVVRDLGEGGVASALEDLAASYQAAIAAQLCDRVCRALESRPGWRVAIGGGVAANSQVAAALVQAGVEPVVPERRFCTDNAAMIARAAIDLPPLDEAAAAALDAFATGASGVA